MRFIIVLLFSVCSCSGLYAQKDTSVKIFAFKITDYINRLSDSAIIVQVLKPATVPVIITEKQLGVLYHSFEQGKVLDSNMIGYGRCQLIKSEYYYFGIKLTKGQQAAGGDVLYLNIKSPVIYNGLLFNVMKHAVKFIDVQDNEFMDANAIFTNSKSQEIILLDSMVSDIHYTGGEMLKLMPEQNQLITDGIFKGKKVFAAMQAATRNDLELFLKYVAARPKIYAGNSWKITETFATWMVGGSPTVKD